MFPAAHLAYPEYAQHGLSGRAQAPVRRHERAKAGKEGPGSQGPKPRGRQRHRDLAHPEEEAGDPEQTSDGQPLEQLQDGRRHARPKDHLRHADSADACGLWLLSTVHQEDQLERQAVR